MVEGAELYRSTFPPEQLTAGGSLRVETRVDCPSIDPKCWGTPDAWFIWGGTLFIQDYKFGHAYVDEFENLQMIAYASGILDTMPHLKRNELKIEFTIVQPRCFTGQGSVRTWRCTLPEIYPHVSRLAAAAAEIIYGNPDLRTGSHCAHCSAIHACPAAQASTSHAIAVTYAPVPAQMRPEELGLVLRRIKFARDVLLAMENGLEEEAEALIRSGTRVPGFDLKPGRGKTEWKRPVEEVVALGQMFDVELSKPGCITPIQAKKLLKEKGIDEAVISRYSGETSGALKLVQSDTNMMRRIFQRKE